MFRRAGKACVAALIVATGLAFAAPASAQFAPIELTQQEYYKLRTIAADAPDGLRSLFRLIYELPPEIEDMLLAFQQEQLRNREASDYLHQRFGGMLDRRSDFAQALADSIIAQTEVLVDGIFRLSEQQQEEYLGFVSLTFDEIAENAPYICADILAGNTLPADIARIDYIGYEALGPDGFADLLALYEEALDAEYENRIPAISFTDDQLEAGETALEVATLALFEDSPLAGRIGETEDFDDLTGDDICALTSLVFDAFETLDQPERTWALRAVLAEGGF